MKRLYYFIILVALIFNGCAKTSVTLLDNTNRPTSEKVDIITDEQNINREYEQIAILNAEGGAGASPGVVIKSMRKKARGLGADAIILAGQGSKNNVMLTGNQAYGASVNTASAVAIVYVKEETSNQQFTISNEDSQKYNAKLDSLTKEINLKRDDHVLYIERGGAHLIARNFEKAILDFDKSIELKPTSSAYYLRSDAKYKHGDYVGAILDYNKVIEESQDSSEAYRQRGLSKIQLSDYRGGIHDLDKALEFDPDDEKAYYGRGLAYILQNQINKGCLDLSKAGELGFTEAYTAIREYCN